MVATDPHVPAPPPPVRRTTAARVVDGLVLAGVAAALAFPAAARIAADRQPVEPRAGVQLPPLADGGRGATLERLPAGAPAASGELDRALERAAPHVSAGTSFGGGATFPYRDPGLARALSDVPPAEAAPVGSGLLLRAAAQNAAGQEAPAAAKTAFHALERASDTGACAPQLNLLALVAADAMARRTAVAGEAENARRACPGDPTPRWLLGQYQSQTGAFAAALATFRALERDQPRSAAGWSGEADTYLRMAFAQPATAAFTARHYYGDALVRYRRAARLDDDPELQFGVARALAGLGHPAQAAALQERTLRATGESAGTLASLVEYLEGAHRHADAARVAERLQAFRRPVAGVFPSPVDPETDDAGAGQPLSLGAARLAPLRVSLPVPATGTDTGGVTVSDSSYLPRFRESAALEGGRWCAGAAAARNLIAAGRPGDALAILPGAFVPVRGHGQGCGPLESPSPLAAIAWLERGDPKRARAAMRADGLSLAQVEDARQNLWRWAGDLEHAERAAREWAEGGDPAALIRLGEIEHLRGRHDAAAEDLGRAAREARAQAGTWSLAEAAATLERAGALLAAHRRPEALAAFAEADETATRALSAAKRADKRAEFSTAAPTVDVLATDTNGSVPAALERVSYYARAELADAAREDRNALAAAEGYAAARELESDLKEVGRTFNVARVANNGAIAAGSLGRAGDARSLARRALATDPRSPLFLTTAAAVAAHTGDGGEAIRRARAAIAEDPTTFPAANDLGVLLARAGRDDEAVAALRRAVGANERYALGWFNLGVVLSGMGPLHLFASQGALARAFTLEPALRDRERRPALDGRTYRGGIDLARPLPPDWDFAKAQRRAPEKTVGLAALLLLALTLGRALSTSGSGRDLAQTWLEPLTRAAGRIRLPSAVRRPAVALAGTLAVLLYPLARDPGGGRTAAAAGALGLLLLIALVWRVRAAAARRARTAATQETWPPGLAFGLGTAVAGLTWTPLPVLKDGSDARTHWAGPLALAVLALPLVLFTAWLDVPLTRALATAALVMAASLLTPVKPVDGGAIAAAGGTAAGLTGAGLAALLALGLV